MNPMRGTWDKYGGNAGEKKEVPVIIHCFSVATYGGSVKPVAVIQDLDTGELRYVELKFLKVG